MDKSIHEMAYTQMRVISLDNVAFSLDQNIEKYGHDIGKTPIDFLGPSE